MLKKYLFGMGLLILFLGMALPVYAAENRDIIKEAQALGYSISEKERPVAFIAVDGETGDILWADHMDKQWDPASMTKLMAIYLFYESMAQGTFTEQTTIKASQVDQAVSQIYEISNNKIVAGVDYPIKDLLTAALVKSSNAAVFMLTNYISEGQHSQFVDRMNLKAQELGMTNTYFYNSSGAVASAYQGYYSPNRYDLSSYNETTAKDLAILAYHLIKDYPEVLDHTDDYQTTIMAGTEQEESFESYNHSLPGGEYAIEGVNGLKTGSSPTARFNSVVTAKRGNASVITVVIGVGDWYDEHSEDYRHIFVNTLLTKGFEDIATGHQTGESILSSSPDIAKSTETKKNLGLLAFPLVGGIGVLAFFILKRLLGKSQAG